MRPSTPFRALIQDPRIRSKQDFRLAANVMEANEFTPHELMAKEPDEIARLLIGCNCRTASQVANRLHRRMNDLAALHPGAGLPVSVVPASSDVRMRALEDEPGRLRSDIRRLRELQAGRASRDDILDRVATATHEAGIRSMREHLAALRRMGMPMSDDVGVRTLMDPVRYSLGLKQLEKERFAASTIYKIALGTLSNAVDLYGDDPSVPLMRAELRGRAPGHELPAERGLGLVEMLAKDGAQRILGAPGLIAARADEKHLTPMARRSRVAMAAAWDLKLNHPRLRPVEVASLHLHDSFDRDGDAWYFKSPAYRGSEASVREPMERSSVDLLLDLEARFGPGGLLFPSRRGMLRHFNPIVMQMYQEFELVTGLRIDFMTIKDLNGAAGCWEEQEEALIKTSQGLGYKGSASFSLRLRGLLKYLAARRSANLDGESPS